MTKRFENNTAARRILNNPELKDLSRRLLLGGAVGFLAMYLAERNEAKWRRFAVRTIPVASPPPVPSLAVEVPIVRLDSRNRRYPQRWNVL